MNTNQIWIALSYKMSTIFCLDIKSTNRRLEKTRSLKYFILRAAKRRHGNFEGGFVYFSKI